jgi:hypothetical protein
LQGGGLRIESGDLSYLLPKPKKPNDKDFNNVPLTDNLTASSNASDVNLVRRQPVQPQAVDTHAGLRAWIFASGSFRTPVDGNNAKKCTLGFAVRKVRGLRPFDHGFLTLGSCMHGNLLGLATSSNGVFYTPNQNWVREEAIRLGNLASLKYNPDNGLNYVSLSLRPNDEQYTL